MYVDRKGGRKMRKMIRVNEKRLAAKYNSRIFLASLPALSVLVSLMVITAIFIVYLDAQMPREMYAAIVYAAYGAFAYGTVVCLIGFSAESILIRAHLEHTYIHISGSVMIVSQHSRSAFLDWKWVHYKKMWVIKLSDVENVECIRNQLTITAKARYFHENAEWLKYSETDEGIAFDRWWYDENGGKTVDTVEVTDFYTYGERIARHINHCAEKTRDREQRRQAFRNEMLEIARNVKRPKGLTDRYVPPEKRRKNR